MRAVLLSDTEVAAYLKENFVLCWRSVCPAPRVTIDFGNGKTLERTIKGNTVFHVCRPDGRVVDSLPGVYTPEDFLQELKSSQSLLEMSDQDVLRRHGGPPIGLGSPVGNEALSKAVLEAPLVKALGARPGSNSESSIVDVSAEPLTLKEYVEIYLPGAGDLAQRALQADSQSSRTVLRPAVHRWFASRSSLPDPDQARDAVYKEILGVDIDDPYLGLRFDDLPGT